MFRWFGSIIFGITVLIVGLSVYLQPDDLRSCLETPGTSAPCQVADAIVVVSGGDTSARTSEAIKLYQSGWADELILVGAAQDKSGPSNAASMRTQAITEGVPAESIKVEEYSETTKQNAENTQSILAGDNVRTAILVTSGYHQRRASLEFQKVAGDVTIYNHPVGQDKDWSAWWWLTSKGWYLAIGEFAKIIIFYLGGSR